MQHTIDPDLLRALVSFEEMGSLARAADRVGRTESTLSLQLKKLDELFGRSLFVHRGRRLVLTEDGCAVLHHARRILAMNDELLSLVHKPRLSGRIRIGTSQDFSDGILPSILRGIVARYPEVKFELQVEGGVQSVEDLERGNIDVAVTIGLGEHPSARRLHRTKVAWIATPEFNVSADQPIPLIIFDQSRFPQQAIDALNAAGLRWEIVFKSSNLTSVWATTRTGIGVTVRSSYWMPAGLVPFYPKHFTLPSLGETDVSIHYYEHTLSPEVRDIVLYIERSLLLQSLAESQDFTAAASGRQ